MQAYFTYMKDVAMLLGADQAAAEQEMLEVIKLEIDIANISLPRSGSQSEFLSEGVMMMNIQGGETRRDQAVQPDDHP